jgi:transposase
LPDHPATRVDELLPWRWKAERASAPKETPDIAA